MGQARVYKSKEKPKTKELEPQPLTPAEQKTEEGRRLEVAECLKGLGLLMNEIEGVLTF